MSRLMLCYIAICDPSLAIVQQCTFGSIGRDVLRYGSTGPSASVTMEASSCSQLNLKKTTIRIILKVRCCFRLYSPKSGEFRTICQLATCDNLRPRTGLGLPP
ncbi:hypothetical protein TNCV_754801 [Trichonephila clavipes]|nr:hypothetical protein TNCV_754801 [Trichonephila clavipes]